MNLKKIDEVLPEDLKIGETYLVTCLVEEIKDKINPEDVWRDDNWVGKSKRKYYSYLPVFNHPHSDKENGQLEEHYHTDDRFTSFKNKSFKEGYDIRPVLNNRKIMYLPLKLNLIHEPDYLITPTRSIEASKLNYKNLDKMRCPHRGYDLSKVCPKEGTITCPLHGLRFDMHTLKVLNSPRDSYDDL